MLYITFSKLWQCFMAVSIRIRKFSLETSCAGEQDYDAKDRKNPMQSLIDYSILLLLCYKQMSLRFLHKTECHSFLTILL